MADLDTRRALILGNAAKTIQRKIRTYIARKYFIALQKAAVCMQSISRGSMKTFLLIFVLYLSLLVKHFSFLMLRYHNVYWTFLYPSLSGRLACQQFGDLKRGAATIKIQTNMRGHLTRKNYSRLKESVVIVQTGVRAMAAHRQFRYKNQTKAATMMQVTKCYTKKISMVY